MYQYEHTGMASHFSTHDLSAAVKCEKISEIGMPEYESAAKD
jgi:hypothetical protein